MLEREMELADQLHQARIEAAQKAATRPLYRGGACLYCGESLAPDLRFCPPEEPGLPGCRDDYEAEQQAKARNGHLA